MEKSVIKEKKASFYKAKVLNALLNTKKSNNKKPRNQPRDTWQIFVIREGHKGNAKARC
jgi:hypothetical protein